MTDTVLSDLSNRSDWFSERAEVCGSAFSMQLKAKLHQETTPYQFIEIYETEWFGKLMVIDGCVMLTERDNFIYHEMMTHPVLFSHPQPKTVWIIGGGDCGSLREVLRHPDVEQVVQIEIDERVTRIAAQYFPELCESNSDPRTVFHFVDGIEWVRQAQPCCVDIIIIDSTDPIGSAKGLFSQAFYADCLRCLSTDGLLVQQSESPLYHMNILQTMYQSMQAAGFSQQQTLFFPQCTYPSGWWSATMATKSTRFIFRQDAARNKEFNSNYYNAEIHRAALTQPEFFKKATYN